MQARTAGGSQWTISKKTISERLSNRFLIVIDGIQERQNSIIIAMIPA
jgi:hypothetical protein